MFRLTGLAMAAALVLTACGGGGGDSTPISTVVNASAEGFWTGPSSTGTTVQLAVLENGETWGFYTSGNILAGALYGATTSNGTAISGSGRDFNFVSRTVTAGTYSGSVSPKSTLSVTTSAGIKFTGSYSSAYDQPASLSSLAGTYSGFAVTGSTAAQSTPVTISASGNITAGGAGCAATGTASPRATGKNIFDVSIAFNGSACALGSGTLTKGIAYFDTGTRQILAMALNPTKSDAFIYVGTR